MVDLVLHNRTKERRFSAAFFRRVAAACEPHLGVPPSRVAEVGITLIGPTAMRSLNRTHRGTDAPTDVLAFPLRTPKIKGYTAVSLGDLFICPSVVCAKAKAGGRTEREQMQWTAVHGLLHLAGYDHEAGPTAARRMAEAERRILNQRV